ncbi:substrate-binding domain-containing protein [Planctomycetota bacterium]
MTEKKSEIVREANGCQKILYGDRRPMHLQLVGILRERFKKLDPGSKLPTVRKLAIEFEVSVGTIAKAVALLEDEGFLQKRQGKGLFVSDPVGTGNGLAGPKHTIGLFLPTSAQGLINNPMNGFVVTDFMIGLGNAAHESGCMLDTRFSEPNGLLKHDISTDTADALVIAVFDWFPGGMEYARRWKGPVVVVDPPEPVKNAVNLITDTRGGVRKAANILIAKGHKRIGFLGGPWLSHTQEDRMLGYQDALVAHDLPVDDSLIVECDGWRDTGRIAAAELLARADRPTAIMCANDRRAFGVLDAAREAGIKVPQDLSVFGFNNITEAVSCTPPLSTIHHPRAHLGATALKTAIDLLAGKEVPDTGPIELKIIERGTTAAAPELK